jgi:hypothetical protein
MTHPGGKDASAPGKTYLFMLTDCQPFLLLNKSPFLDSQETPVEILELPVGSDTSDLEHHHTVIGQEVVHLFEKGTVSPNTDVLGHLEAGDLVEVALWVRDVSEVHAEDSSLVVGNAVLLDPLSTESSLLLGQGDYIILSAPMSLIIWMSTYLQ